MLFASSRSNLFNSEDVGPHTTYHDVTIANQVAVATTAIDETDFLGRIDGENILLLVHGYNNDFNDVVRAYDAISEQVNANISDYYSAVIGYTWPGCDSGLEYFKAKQRAGVVAPRFASLLTSLVGVCDTVDVMSHSMGARVVMRSLTDSRVQIRCNYLMASAIDNESIQSNEQFAEAIDLVEGTVVFHTKHDAVLKYAYAAAEWDYALGYLGPEDPADILNNIRKCSVANCKNVVSGHGQYKYSAPVFQFINQWLSGEVDESFTTL